MYETAFWARVDRGTPSDCWEWQAGRVPAGYGVFAPAHDVRFYAHRYSYELQVGPIPPGKEIDHLCHNTSCVNPAHLEPVTHRENTLRTLRSRRSNEACPKGHARSEYGTTRPDSNGTPIWHCKECHRIQVAEARSRWTREDKDRVNARARASYARRRAAHFAHVDSEADL